MPTQTTVMIVRDAPAIRRALFDAGRTDTPVEIAAVGGAGKFPDPIMDLRPRAEWPPNVTFRDATLSEESLAEGRASGWGFDPDPRVMSEQLGSVYVY